MQRTLSGTVVSTKMDKTIVVRVETKYRHPLYKKVVKTHKKYKAHCEDKSIQEGDVVTIVSTKPMSKEKSFIVLSKKS